MNPSFGVESVFSASVGVEGVLPSVVGDTPKTWLAFSASMDGDGAAMVSGQEGEVAEAIHCLEKASGYDWIHGELWRGGLGGRLVFAHPSASSIRLAATKDKLMPRFQRVKPNEIKRNGED